MLDLDNIEGSVQNLLHQIIDELHPLFTAISDEEPVEETDSYGVYVRDFLHSTGKKFRMKWKVVYGTPETVNTVFYKAEVLS